MCIGGKLIHEMGSATGWHEEPYSEINEQMIVALERTSHLSIAHTAR